MSRLSDFRELESSAKVLFLDQSGELGGAELSLMDIISRRSGHSVVYLFSDGPFYDALVARNIKARVLGLKKGGIANRFAGPLGVVRSIPAMFGLLSRVASDARKFDVLYANTMKAFVVACIASPFHRRPLVWHFHDMLTDEHFSPLLQKVIIGLANRFVDKLIVNSTAVGKAFEAKGGKLKPIVIHNGIDSDPITQIDAGEARQKIVRKAGFKADDPIIGIFSRLARWKGQHVVIDALRELPKCQLLIVGGALFGETEYEAELRAKVEAYKLGNRVAFLGHQKDISELVKGVDIVVHASVSPEPFGRVIVEGMLAEKPVIATKGGGVEEIISDGRNGLVTPPGDAQALKGQLSKLISNPAFAKDLASSGLQNALTNFSLKDYALRVEAVIDSARY